MTASPKAPAPHSPAPAIQTPAIQAPAIQAPAIQAPAIQALALTLTLGSSAGGEATAAVPILRGLSLTIPTGQTVALLGPSGSGKSSLMAVLAGLERATSGQLTVAGADFTGLSEDALARARRGRIGVVLQAFHLLPTMTAQENVEAALDLAGIPDAPARATQELSEVGLAHRLHHYPAQLSGGEQQRVAIARALAPRPAIIFADEPTGNLDTTTGAEIVELLFARQQLTGATLIVITHDESLARRCQRIIRLADGAIASDTLTTPTTGTATGPDTGTGPSTSTGSVTDTNTGAGTGAVTPKGTGTATGTDTATATATGPLPKPRTSPPPTTAPPTTAPPATPPTATPPPATPPTDNIPTP